MWLRGIDAGATPSIASLPDVDSARQTFRRSQTRALAVCGIVILLGLVLWRVGTLEILISLAIAGYVFSGGYKIYVLYRAAREGIIAHPPLTILDEDLPRYTVLAPLYREAGVLPDLLEAMRSLDYPVEKLEVLLLLEADDEETIEACRERILPDYIRPLIVPQGTPKTKPRACNAALAAATGDYLVIFDAEDRPERDQLRKALAAFADSSPDTVCQQAKLSYYNQRQTVLTRFFTLDYAQWFDGILPGLTRLRAPIPLGGTSNHFRTTALRELSGWDPYNVAEDADLGIRLARRGYYTGIIDSTTWEEATSRVPGWLRQRSRWVKGYMQTVLVHTRRPRQLRRELGTANTLSFLALVASTPITGLLNPLFWALGIAYYTTRSTAIEAIFPTPIYYLGLTLLIGGNFLFIYTYMFTAVRWGYDDLVKWALLVPLYWVLFSVAVYMALYELIRRPHHWQKTTHGLVSAPLSTETERLAAGLTAPHANPKGGR